MNAGAPAYLRAVKKAAWCKRDLPPSGLHPVARVRSSTGFGKVMPSPEPDRASGLVKRSGIHRHGGRPSWLARLTIGIEHRRFFRHQPCRTRIIVCTGMISPSDRLVATNRAATQSHPRS